MIKLTEVIVRRPIAAIMIIGAIIIFGAMALMSMPQELNPEMDFPMLVVSTIYPGAGPEDIEELLSRPIKDSLGAQSGIRNIISNSMENASLLMLQFEFGYDMNRAYNDVSRSMDAIANSLPSGSMSPMVLELDINAAPTMTLSVHSDTIENLLYYVEDQVVPQLERLTSVSSVGVSGGRVDYVRVEVIEEMLVEYGLTISNVIGAVAGVNHTAPLGTADFGDLDLAMRVQVRHETIDALNRIPITLRTGDVIRLADVARIYVSTQDADSISRYNGQENIGISIHNPQAVSANQTSVDVMRAINSIMRDNPDISIVVVNDDSEMIADSINSVAQTLILAIFFAMVILYLFFGDIRACLIVGSSMPISLLGTFIFMDFMGFTLNVVSMSGLVIGVGMMVDNAIVVLDSCFKSMSSGKRDFADSAVAGTKFVMLSIFAVTMTTVAVFVPLSTIQGMAGQMFAPLGLSIVFALISSLISAVTLVPLFFVQFKPVENEKALAAKVFAKLESGYARVLKSILKKKKTVVVVTAGIMGISIFLAGFLNFELMPTSDMGIIVLGVETRPGLNLERVDTIMTELEEIVAAHPDVSHFTLTTSGSGGLLGGGGGATLTAFLHSDRQMQTGQIIEQWRHETRYMLDSDIDISTSYGMPGGGDGIDILLEGDNLDAIREGAALVEAFMHSVPGIIRVNSTVDRTNPQAEIVVDPLMAASMHITPQMITGSIFTALNGSEVTEATIDGQRYSIWVKYPPGRYESVSDIANMMIMSGIGTMVPLSDISAIEFSDTPQTIVRQNGLYTVTITGVATEAARFTAQSAIQQGVNQLALPSGVYVGQAMMDEMMVDEFTSLGIAIAIAILLVFMILAIQFESIRHSLMVMTCIPLAIIGSLLLMFVTGTTLSMISLLGFLILIGLVVNNGILFVDTTNKYRGNEGMEITEALINAGRVRLRPILMITLTTILALLPLSLGFGEDMMQGLGITVIGGLTASTTLALLLLPTFYLILDGNPEKRAERKRRRTEKRERKIAAQN